MRVVLDTNVIISGLLWKGPPKTLFDLVQTGKLTPCLTPGILQEVRRVLQYPKILKPLNAAGMSPDDVIGHLVKEALIFPDESLVRIVKEDPSDDMFLNCAIVSAARWLVSGDQHLLRIGHFGNIAVVTPGRFLKQLE